MKYIVIITNVITGLFIYWAAAQTVGWWTVSTVFFGGVMFNLFMRRSVLERELRDVIQ